MARNEVDILKEREKCCVCKMCGGPLELRLIIHNQYGGQGLDLYCPACDRLEYGTEPYIYDIAKKFVDRFEFNYYTDMEENTRNYQLNIGKICDIAAWILKEMEERNNL